MSKTLKTATRLGLLGGAAVLLSACAVYEPAPGYGPAYAGPAYAPVAVAPPPVVIGIGGGYYRGGYRGNYWGGHYRRW